jgi:uncharacterized membrane protein SpoIIM required for sporulation
MKKMLLLFSVLICLIYSVNGYIIGSVTNFL